MFISADVTFCSASIYSLIGISLDRFYAIFYPLEYVTKRKRSTAILMIVSAWIMGLLISTPMYIDAPGFSNLNRDIINNDNGSVNCMPPVSKTLSISIRVRVGKLGNISKPRNLKFEVHDHIWPQNSA